MPPTQIWEGRAEKFATRPRHVSYLAVTVSSKKTFYSAMRKSSWIILYSAVAMPPTRPWGGRVGWFSTRPQWRLWLGCDGIELESLLLVHSDASYSAMTIELESLLLDHEKAESKSLLLWCGDASQSAMRKLSRKSLLYGHHDTSYSATTKPKWKASYFVMRKSSRKLFYMAVEMPPTKPWGSGVGRSSTWSSRHLQLGYDGVESERLLLAMAIPFARPSRSRVKKSYTRPWRRLPLGHEEAESEGILLGHGGIFNLGMTVSSRKALYSSITMLTQKGFYSATTTSPILPWRCRVGNPTISLGRRLLLGHDDADSEGLLLGRGEVSDSAMMM